MTGELAARTREAGEDRRPTAGRGSGRLAILHFLAPAPFGGLESTVAGLASGHARRGHRVGVVAVLEPDGIAPTGWGHLEEAGVEVFRWRIPARAYLSEVRAVRDLCDRWSPDVVHTHGYRSDVVAGLTARTRGAPVVSTVHGFLGGGWKNRLYERIQRWVLRSFDAVVAVSEPLERELGSAGVTDDRLHVVRNAAVAGEDVRLLPRKEARAALGLDDAGFVTGFVGRLSREKGPDVLLDAVAADPGPFGTVVLVGDGVDRRELEASAARRGLADRVRFTGEVPEAGRLFRAFDLFVLSSRTEGTPVVLLEAMAAGVPVVAARVGGVPDVVGSGEAWLVPPEDAGALADAVGDARRDREEAERRADAAADRLARAFAVGPWLDRYEEIYRDVAGVRAPRRDPSAGSGP